jgi:integration host factor subunit beta
MNRSDLVDRIADKASLQRRQAEDVVNVIFDAMCDALAREERIEIRGFGSFVVKHYRARTGRNPRTGDVINVSSKRLPTFKVGKELRARVDAGQSKAISG